MIQVYSGGSTVVMNYALNQPVLNVTSYLVTDKQNNCGSMCLEKKNGQKSIFYGQRATYDKAWQKESWETFFHPCRPSQTRHRTRGTIHNTAMMDKSVWRAIIVRRVST